VQVARLTPVFCSLNGWGLTIVDSLDTMLLMGLKPQFTHAVHEHVVDLNFTEPLRRSVRGAPSSIPAFTPLTNYWKLVLLRRTNTSHSLKPKFATLVVCSLHTTSPLHRRMKKYVRLPQYYGRKQKHWVRRCCQRSIPTAASPRRPLIRAGMRDANRASQRLPFTHVY